MNSQKTTNALLAIIAVLMTVLVIQNQGPSAPRASAPPAPAVSNANPHAGMGGGHLNPAEMVYQAMRCPENPQLTLADTSCASSAEALTRKKTVDAAFAQGLPLGRVFDEVIKAHGENVLTEEALQIIKSRRGS